MTCRDTIILIANTRQKIVSDFEFTKRFSSTFDALFSILHVIMFDENNLTENHSKI